MAGPAVAFFASRPHYQRHLKPIRDAIIARGHDAKCWSNGDPHGDVMTLRDAQAADCIVVASHHDALDGRFAGKPMVYVEHGAGQSYIGAPRRGYPGDPEIGHVGLFLCPNSTVAGAWRRSYSHAQIEVVGCPALDVHFSQGTPPADDAPAIARPDRGVVAFTFHWDNALVPETKPALPHYEKALPATIAALRARGLDVLGTSHARHTGPSRRLWERLSVEYVPDPDEVLRRAALVVADNTSLLYEAAAVGTPVLALNAPWYRRHVHHGLRFWSHVPGVQCDEPTELLGLIEESMQPGVYAMSRAGAVERVYEDTLDGKASERAAEVIARFVLRR